MTGDEAIALMKKLRGLGYKAGRTLSCSEHQSVVITDDDSDISFTFSSDEKGRTLMVYRHLVVPSQYAGYNLQQIEEFVDKGRSGACVLVEHHIPLLPGKEVEAIQRIWPA